MHHVTLLDPFFHDNGEGELVRDKSPKGGWTPRAKDLRLARGYVLRATCKRRFLGWRTSFLELSEREVSDFVGPQALRMVAAKEEEEGAIYAKPIEIPLNKQALQALDAIVGNDDGHLFRQGKDFSYSCSDVSLARATLLVASMPKGATTNLCVVLLEEAELAVLREADARWKQEQAEAAAKKREEAAAAAAAAAPQKMVDLGGKSHRDAAVSSVDAAPAGALPFSLFSCCFLKPAQQQRRGTINKKNSILTKPSFTSPGERAATSHVLPSSSSAAATVVGTVPAPVAVAAPIRHKLVIGTAPELPPLHREVVNRTITQIGQAASSDTYDASWKRVGSLDGLTWLMKDGGKVFMVRGTLRAPARSVFDFVWLHEESLVEIEPRIATVTPSPSSSGENQLKFYHKSFGKEWLLAMMTGNKEEGDGEEQQVLKHYHVHADGTIFIVEIGNQTTGGLVISPAGESCHVAWVEMDQQQQTLARNLAPWAAARAGSIQTKLLGERLHHLRQFGLSSSNFELDLKAGSIVNMNGTSDGEVDVVAVDFRQQMRMRENHFLASRKKGDLSLVKSQVNKAMAFVNKSIPDERKRFRASWEAFEQVLNDFLDSRRLHLLKNGAQYPFDCIMMWILTNLPTQESWVEALAEQLSMRNVEAQSAYGRSEHMQDGNQIVKRISQILKSPQADSSRDERLPSL